MGWFKNFAEGFAEGYVKERGVNGTINDINELVSGFVDSEDESDSNFNEDAWNRMNDDVDRYVDNLEFDKAERCVIRYYERYENGEADFFYYRLRAYISIVYYENLEYDSDELKPISQEIDEFLSRMKSEANGADKSNRSQYLSDYNTLKDRFKKASEENKQAKAYMAQWNKTRDEIYGKISAQQYEQALVDINKYYDKYETKRDYHYFLMRADVYEDMFANKGFGCNDRATLMKLADEVIPELNNCIRKMKELCDSDNESQSKNIIRLENSLNTVKDYIEQQSEDKSATTNAEREYVDELKACLADNGEISDRERRILNKLRDSLGISETRAIELEKKCATSLSKVEQEYVDELKACLADNGEISDRERRILNKLRDSLGISEERAVKLEMML